LIENGSSYDVTGAKQYNNFDEAFVIGTVISRIMNARAGAQNVIWDQKFRMEWNARAAGGTLTGDEVDAFFRAVFAF
jgi:hypothetical protein